MPHYGCGPNGRVGYGCGADGGYGWNTSFSVNRPSKPATEPAPSVRSIYYADDQSSRPELLQRASETKAAGRSLWVGLGVAAIATAAVSFFTDDEA